jgi:hypothetical protein
MLHFTCFPVYDGINYLRSFPTESAHFSLVRLFFNK